MAADRPNFLAAYETWVRAGRVGLAPSPLPYGLLTGDVLTDICTIDETLRKESGLGSWMFYAPRSTAAPMSVTDQSTTR